MDADASEPADFADLREEWNGNAAAPTPAPASPPSAPAARIEPPPPTAPISAEHLAKNQVHGIARDINIRSEGQNQQQKLTFRVDRYDLAGNRMPPVPVELERYRGGLLTDGDEVVVTGRWSHGTLRAARISNVTTASDVRGWFSGKKRYIIWAIVILVLIVVALVIVYAATYKPAQPS